MMTVDILPLIRDVARRRQNNTSLESLAARTRQSRFQFHRAFQRVTGETPKQFTLRIGLEFAAAKLAATEGSVLSIAMSSGFAGHEVFSRAFRRRYGISPLQYRTSTWRLASKAERTRHLAIIEAVAPCIRFLHAPAYKSFKPQTRSPMPLIKVERKEVAPLPILFIRRRIAPSKMKDTLGECFGKIVTYATKNGLPLAGWPLCRYISTGLGLWTIEPAMPLAAPAQGEGEIQFGMLYSGPVAFAVHSGLYEDLPNTNAEVERWIEANGFEARGETWEQYVTDPGEHPNPADWRTELYWPLRK